MSTCEWNPSEDRPAFEDDEPHGQSVMMVGASGQWHLCASCAQLPRFSRYVKRPLRRMVPDRTVRRIRREEALTKPRQD